MLLWQPKLYCRESDVENAEALVLILSGPDMQLSVRLKLAESLLPTSRRRNSLRSGQKSIGRALL